VRLVNGNVLVATGVSHSSALASAELYSPATNTWSSAASLRAARTGAVATLLKSGNVLVAGGWNGTPLSSAELYHPATNTWSAAGTMASPRQFATATRLTNGNVLVAGGWNGTYLSSAEIYHPASNTWSPAGSMAVARDVASASLLASGQVLVAGGANNTGDLSSAELYDPVTNTWSLSDPLATPRATQVAEALPNGTVLVAGGASNGVYTASAELYDPTLGFPWVIRTTESGRVGSTITIVGRDLSDAIEVFIDGVPATFKVLSAAEVTAIVPLGALTGPVAITTAVATTWSRASLKVLPRISGFSPASAKPGATVTITGSALTGASRVTFNGRPSVFSVEGTKVVAVVPKGATTGPIAVTTAGGTARSAAAFTVT